MEIRGGSAGDGYFPIRIRTRIEVRPRRERELLERVSPPYNPRLELVRHLYFQPGLFSGHTGTFLVRMSVAYEDPAEENVLAGNISGGQPSLPPSLRPSCSSR